jgi:hypothetical protein
VNFCFDIQWLKCFSSTIDVEIRVVIMCGDVRRKHLRFKFCTLRCGEIRSVAVLVLQRLINVQTIANANHRGCTERLEESFEKLVLKVF